jgi:hypothetical protein
MIIDSDSTNPAATRTRSDEPADEFCDLGIVAIQRIDR